MYGCHSDQIKPIYRDKTTATITLLSRLGKGGLVLDPAKETKRIEFRKVLAQEGSMKSYLRTLAVAYKGWIGQ